MNASIERRSELSDFLRTRRAKIVPSDVGLADGARRRTPGLRREEVALLANIGTTWYTRLEQGLPINVSAEVLDGISRALRLTSDERRHLHLLAGLTTTVSPPHEEHVSELVRRVLAALEPSPAYVRGRRFDLLAWNRSADALSDFSGAAGPARNMVWRLFRDPTTQCRLGDPECAKRRIVAQFRAVAAKYPHDPAFTELIEELRLTSPEIQGTVGATRRAGLDRRPKTLRSSRPRRVDSGLHELRSTRRRRYANDRADGGARFGERRQAAPAVRGAGAALAS